MLLSSYLASLHSIAVDPSAKFSKGKDPVVSCFPLNASTCNSKVCVETRPWSPHAAWQFKLNTDVSVLNGVAGAGMNMILRDHEGGTIFSSYRRLFDVMICVVRVHSMKDGLMLASEWSNLPIDVESGSHEAVKMLQSGDTNKSKYTFLPGGFRII